MERSVSFLAGNCNSLSSFRFHVSSVETHHFSLCFAASVVIMTQVIHAHYFNSRRSQYFYTCAAPTLFKIIEFSALILCASWTISKKNEHIMGGN